jgi:site-specific DNA recombinase
MGESDKTPRRSAKKARCAIYTRKSSEECLEQGFNSLDAQREACAAFILYSLAKARRLDGVVDAL